MKSITNSAIVEKIKGTGRTFTASIKVGTKTFTTVKSLRQSSIFASSQKLSVGETVSSFIEAEINECRESLQNYEVEASIAIGGYNISLGLFTVQAPSQADGSGTQKITAYDRMALTSQYTYTAKGLTSAISTFSAICQKCGFTAITSGLTDVAINDKLLDGMNCRVALGYVAGVLGKNCVVTTDGKFKMAGYTKIAESDCKISIDSLDTLDFPSKVSTIDYFNAVVNEANIYKSGTGNNGVNVVNPLFKDTSQTYSVLTQLQSTVGSNGYYPAKFKQLNGDPRIEVGDVIKVEHRDTLTGEVTSDYVPVMSLVMDYDGGVTVSIEAYPTESEFSMSLSDKVDLTNSSNNAKFEDINNKVDGFEEDIDGANTKADFAVIQSQAVEELNKVIGNSLGLYQTKIEGAGGDTKYYFHNKSTLAESTYIVSMTDQGFAFANSWNNGNPVWNYGITKDGNAIFNYLVAEKISANLIEAGVIKSLDNAPIKTELSLNTGLMSMIATARKQGFAFGVNKSNDLTLQYNYSESNKLGVKSGYYYNQQFYADSKHTELISPSSNYYYGDLTSGDFYEYTSNKYSKITDLSVISKTYKGFIMHSMGATFGYEVHDEPNLLGEYVTSDFSVPSALKGNLFGIYEGVEDDPNVRTPILKYYDYELESAESNPHFTEIRKQSISTKYLGAEKFCFYFNNKATDIETLFNEAQTTISALNDETAVLKSEIRKLQDILGTKSLTVYVNANPTTGGIIQSGTGSYTLEDGSFTVSAYRIGDYNVSSVTLVYASDGSTTTYSKAQLTANGWLNSAETRLDMTLPVESSRLGDTLNVTVNFSEPEKYTVTVNAEPTAGGRVSGGGPYTPNTNAILVATSNTNYKFNGWYEDDILVATSNTYEIIVSNDRTLTAKFEAIMTAKIEAIGNATDTVYISSSIDGGTNLGTSATFSKNQNFYYYAKAGSNRVITDVVIGSTYYSADELVNIGALNEQRTILNYPMWVITTHLGSTLKATITFADEPTGDDTTYYMIQTSVSPSGAGFVSGGGSYPSGSSVSVTAEPENGYVFSHWNVYNPVYNQTVENASTDNPWNITAAANVTLTAVFTSTSGGGSSEGSVNINITKIGDGTVTVKRNGVDVTNTSEQYSFSVGDTVTLEAISYAGSDHYGWLDGDGNWISHDSDYTFTVSSNTPAKISAWFRAN